MRFRVVHPGCGGGDGDDEKGYDVVDEMKDDTTPQATAVTCTSTSTTTDVWWRAYNVDGIAFDCGSSSDEMEERGTTVEWYETSHTIFAWSSYNRYHHRCHHWQFYPEGLLPIPTKNPSCTFIFDRHGRTCYPSHFVLYVINKTSSVLDVHVKEGDGQKHQQTVESQEQIEICFLLIDVPPKELLVHVPDPMVIIAKKDALIGCKCAGVTNGTTITVVEEDEHQEQKKISCKQVPLKCPIPIHDVPIRCINRSGEKAIITVRWRNGPKYQLQVDAYEPPFVFWLPSHPIEIEWSTKSMVLPSCVIVPYQSGMTLVIRSPQAMFANQLLLDQEATLHPDRKNSSSTKLQRQQRLLGQQQQQEEVYNDIDDADALGPLEDASQFVTLLEEAGELERCAELFVAHLVEGWQVPLLSDKDWERLGIKIGSKLRIQERLRQWGLLPLPTTTSAAAAANAAKQSVSASSGGDPKLLLLHSISSTKNDYDYDIFLSHRHQGGEDLAQAIKLQLQVMFPKRMLRIFLDVDDLKNLARLKHHVTRSRNFLLLLTPGALERPYIQLEIQSAIEAKTNIVLVHDVKNCPLFPQPSSVLPETLRSVLEVKTAIPYHREQAFRATSMREIAKAVGLLPDST